MPKRIKKIVSHIKQSPQQVLALGRTIMANERTLLSFVRTSIGLLGGGIALIKFLEHPGLIVLGWIFIIASIVSLIWGIKRYRYMKRLLEESYAEMTSPPQE